MKPYLDLLKDVQDNGRIKADRTGTGTRAVFGRQLRFDLSQGFPLLATKKMFIKGIVAELLWFLSGDTNNRTLTAQGVHIWDAWAQEDGELGPIYSHMWRRFGAKPGGVRRRYPKLRSGLTPSYLGVGNGAGKQDHPLGKTWEGMMARCYDKRSSSFETYGRVGVVVCDRWLEFAAFADDAVKLPGWDLKAASMVEAGTPRYVIDKDLRGDGFTYSPECCAWITDAHNQLLRADTLYTVEKGGQEHQFINVQHFCAAQGAAASNFSDLWTGDKNAKVRDGFRFVSKVPLNPGVDQIARLVEGLKNDPTSRRHIVSGWDPRITHLMALPPCHCLFQFYCEELTDAERKKIGGFGEMDYVTFDDAVVPRYRLSCQLYQRSARSALAA